VKEYHEANRVFSSSAINITALTSVATGDESVKLALIKTHGEKKLLTFDM